MRLIIDIPKGLYERIKWLCENGMGDDLQKKVINGTVLPDNATRKDVHELIFGIDPPELGSPYCACANEGCEMCIHKDDLNCDVNWWNAPYQKGGKETAEEGIITGLDIAINVINDVLNHRKGANE